MIARLEGVLREKSPTRVVLDVAGVGYEVLVSLSTFAELPDEGKTVSLHVHTHVRDDAFQLFGFQSGRERQLFELLIRTSGVGPKLAQAILSSIAPDDLVEALRTGSVVTLRGVPGVGLKTAERIVVDLRDRVAPLLDGAPEASKVPPSAALDPRVEAVVSALVNLGTPVARAQRAAQQAFEELGAEGALETLIRAALRRLTR